MNRTMREWETTFTDEEAGVHAVEKEDWAISSGCGTYGMEKAHSEPIAYLAAQFNNKNWKILVCFCRRQGFNFVIYDV